MAEPAQQIETDYVRIAISSFDLRWTSEVERCRISMGLDVLDLHDALLDAVAKRSNKLDAKGASFDVVGVTCDDVPLHMQIWVDPDECLCSIEKLNFAAGVSGDDQYMEKAINDKTSSQ